MTDLERILPEINSAQAKLLYRTICEKLPEKRTATMVLGCPYCKRNFPIIEEEYNQALTEVETILRIFILGEDNET
jgi:hypothetical protein